MSVNEVFILHLLCKDSLFVNRSFQSYPIIQPQALSRLLCAQLLLSRVPLFVTPWTVAHQASLSMGFSRQEYWSGLPFPIPGDLPNPGIEPTSAVFAALAGGPFTIEPPRKSSELLNTPIIQNQITPLYAIAEVTHLHHLFLKKSRYY